MRSFSWRICTTKNGNKRREHPASSLASEHRSSTRSSASCSAAIDAATKTRSEPLSPRPNMTKMRVSDAMGGTTSSDEKESEESIVLRTTSNSSHGGTDRAMRTPSMGNVQELWKVASQSLPFYIGIEAAWHVGLFAVCYRYRPLVRMGNSSLGQRVLKRIQKVAPSASSGSSTEKWTQRCGAAVSKVPGGSRTLVAASEWFFFNKVVGIPLWPTKLMLAGWLNKQLEHSNHQLRAQLLENPPPPK